MCFRRKVELNENLVINKENLKELHGRMLPKIKDLGNKSVFGVNLNFHEIGQFTRQDRNIFLKLF